MTVHIVMMRFKDENKVKNLDTIKSMLETLEDKIEPLLDMDVGVDFSHSERSMDMVLTATFANKEGLQTYRTHPAHLDVLAHIKEVITQSVVVDYEKA